MNTAVFKYIKWPVEYFLIATGDLFKYCCTWYGTGII
jgi:hypothetical protein